MYVWDGDYYALEPMRALGLAESGGAVRAGFLHYTSEEEVDRLLEELTDLVKGLTPTNFRSDPHNWLPLASGTLLRVRPLTVGFRPLPDRAQPGAPDQRAARHHDPPVPPELPPGLLGGAHDARLGGDDRATGPRPRRESSRRPSRSPARRTVTNSSRPILPDAAVQRPEPAHHSQDELVGVLGEQREPAARHLIEDRRVGAVRGAAIHPSGRAPPPAAGAAPSGRR